MTMVSPLIPWLVWVVPLAGAVLTPLVAKAGNRIRDYFAVLVSLVSAVMAAQLLPLLQAGEELHHQIEWIPSLGIRAGVLADSLSVILANVVAWISFLIMLYSLGYMKGEPNLTRYWFFMNFFIGNMQLIVLSDNLLQLFFGWEGVGMASYALIGFWHTDELRYWVGRPGHKALGLEQAYPPSHAGMKAFITTKIGDIAFLIGMLLLFAYAGTFEFKELLKDTRWAEELARAGLFAPVAILIFGGAIGKSAQFPLHEWLPDAMAGPTSVSALIHAATMVKAGVFLVARVGPIFAIAVATNGLAVPFFSTIAWIGAFTAFLAASQAMVNDEVKKVLAYSTVSQIGLMMLALGAAGLVADFAAGYAAGIFHLTSHALFKAALFLAAGAVLHATETRFMSEMGGLRRHMPITFLAMLLGATSLAGIPPLSGFWSKDAILASLGVLKGGLQIQLLYLLAILASLMTVFYSFRMIGLIFFGPKSHHLEELEREGHHLHEAPKVMWFPYLALGVATLGLGLLGPFAEDWFEGSLAHLLEEGYGMALLEAPKGLDVVAIGSSLLVIAIGGSMGYLLYIARRWDPRALVEGNAILRALHTFLLNRWYINALYYWIFVKGTTTLGLGAYRRLEAGLFDPFNELAARGSIFFGRLGEWFDVHVIDGIVNGSAIISQAFSQLLRRIQTGIAEHYVFAFALGILMVLLIMLLLV